MTVFVGLKILILTAGKLQIRQNGKKAKTGQIIRINVRVKRCRLSRMMCNGTQIFVIIELLYYNFCNLGCQGDRTPMYRASAPFFEGDKGDRRVTGVCAHSQKMGNITTVCPALIQMKNRCFCERTRLLESNSLENLSLNARLSNALGGVNLQILSRI